MIKLADKDVKNNYYKYTPYGLEAREKHKHSKERHQRYKNDLNQTSKSEKYNVKDEKYAG